ncbi:MAG: carbamoyl-phosphate synthase large subunit [Syntrophobacterales bacterium]|jgi:carbamoyl-phosphate synthase large subunit|nr:carbamoyl-phosphate synthase large subunit [Syntrophobacterales bacterium]
MPKRTDIKSVLIIGSGPIIIGQACEFDYSGSQACKALREEGYRVILVNSNPATIMTDPDMADRVYVEPLIPEILEEIIRIERPDTLLPTIGGQTGLNLATILSERGVLGRYNVELIGANYAAIKKAEDREEFKAAMERINLEVPKSGLAHNMKDAKKVAKEIGFPLIIRPSYTLGGTGASVCYNIEEFESLAQRGLEHSMINEILIEESVLGWKEYEFEVIRDKIDNVIIICSIENFDPMGIHTGDSIAVAPAQTMNDKEYQNMRNASIRIIREIGVETGGSNIQFAVNQDTGRMVVIEMNPRVSRSSALASKATGFPIAKIAAKLAIGYTLDEIPNDITKKTPASFEPAIDYCVVKIPRFTFEKFKGADETLTVSMKSVGEVMSIGRTFKEALQKGLRSLETGVFGLNDERLAGINDHEWIKQKLIRPNKDRVFYIRHALRAGFDIDEIYAISGIDRWFLKNIEDIIEFERELELYRKDRPLSSESKHSLPEEVMLKAKKYGFSDRQLGDIVGHSEEEIRAWRISKNIRSVFKLVDTCAAEFEAYTPYYYSTYETEDESRNSDKQKIMILGGGPNRIGQGIEFDYCCVHAAFALKDLGYETIMVNSNPETVSTDYDTSDKLYFEPLALENVLDIVEREKPAGVIVQFGGQTPLNLAVPLKKAGVHIIGTTPESIDIAEDRDKFKTLLKKLDLTQPENGIAVSFEEARDVANVIGYPVVVRPSYVLGGRAMEIVYGEEDLKSFMVKAAEASPERPILIDKFLEDAIEIDVDAVADGEKCVVAGIMEHIEEAGIHSGDSACAFPPYSLDDTAIEKIKTYTYKLAKELNVIGLMNIQYAVKNDIIYVLEVNPRASRTIPFVSKATGIQWAKVAAKMMVGLKLKDLGIEKEIEIKHIAVKESVFPFNKFAGVDTILGPEMKSTGEVMGIDDNFGAAFWKAQLGAGQGLPSKGNVFVSIKNKDKRNVIFITKKLSDLGFKIYATRGTGKVLANNGIEVKFVHKVSEGRPHIVDMIKNGEISFIINTPSGRNPKQDEVLIRSGAIQYNIPYTTTLSGAQAVVNAIESMRKEKLRVKALQDYYI